MSALTSVFGIPIIYSPYVKPGTALFVGGSVAVGEEPCPVCHVWGGPCRTRRGHRRHDHRARGSWSSDDADTVIGALLDHIEAVEQQDPGGHRVVSHPEATTSVTEGET